VRGALQRFLHRESSSGLVLLAATAVALACANSPIADAYHHLWETKLGPSELGLRLSLEHWINDGLMVVFFLVIGLEVKRELVLGELRDPRRAALPVVAAVGGMVAPALVYLALAGGGPAARGWGIPMATDIAFVVGCMALLGSRVPHGLRVMLLTLAIADDVGAILVIAIGYASGLDLAALLLGVAGFGVVVALQRLGVRAFGVYVGVGVLIWWAFLRSGVHATVAGVVLGMLTPTRPLFAAGELGPAAISPLAYLEQRLHLWVGFVVMPIFALANAGVPVRVADLGDPVALAVATGLVIGKPVGVAGAAWLAVRAGVARLPDGVGWPAITGAGLLAGIGFTMSLFIASLALEPVLRDVAKVGILGASALAAVGGMLLLLRVLPAPAPGSSGRDDRHP
jgi:Na+:H+ antiporter, NhaA family